MDVQIRLANSEDFASILELQAISLKLNIKPDGYSVEQVDSLIRSQKPLEPKSLCTTFVADYQSQIVGFACLSTFKAQITGIYVHPNFIRLGIGSKLLQALEDKAIQQNRPSIHVLAALPAENFYLARGYDSQKEVGFWSEGTVWIPCIQMQKIFRSPTLVEQLIRYLTYFIFGLIIFRWLYLLLLYLFH